MSGNLRACLLLAMLGFGSLALAAEMREWVDKTGKFRVEAELVETTDKGVKLRKADGKIITVAVDKLSQADVDYLKTQEGETKKAEKAVVEKPIESVVRINVPVEGASGPEQDLIVVGFAVEVEGQTASIVLATRGDLSPRVPEEAKDESLAKSTFLHLRQDRDLGAIERLGFGQPQGELKTHDRLLVLVGEAKARIPALPLAEREAEVGDVVQVPLLPTPTRSRNTRRTAKPEIKWTKWKIRSINAFGMFMTPVDGKFPHSGALPIVDADYKVVGVYDSMAKASETSEVEGFGFPLSDIRGALTKAKLLEGSAGRGEAGTTASTGKSLFPGVMPIPQGPIDETAAWRTDYDAFVKTIKVTKGADGESEFDWGEAQDFGAWYERCRVIGPKMDEMMRNPETRRQLVKELEPMMTERDLAGERLQGVEWGGVAKQISPKSTGSSRFELAPLPEQLRLTFWAEEGNEDAWRQVNKGDKVRFGCRFIVRVMGENPSVDVYMTFKEVVVE